MKVAGLESGVGRGMRFRVLTAIATVLCLLAAVPTRSHAQLRMVHETNSARLIIFVHGLWGDPETTFAGGGHTPTWFDIVKSDQTVVRNQPALSTYSIGYLTYPAGRTDRLSVPQVVEMLGRELRDHGLLDRPRELYFVTHSLGGIVIKELMLTARGNESLKALVQRTKGILLISTPTSGSDAADFVANRLPTIIGGGRIIADLKSIGDNSFLQSLERNWSNFLRVKNEIRPAIYCAYETKPTMGLMIVPEQNSERQCDENAAAINEDHISIVKPASAATQIHVWLRGSLADIAVKRSIRENSAHPPVQTNSTSPRHEQPAGRLPASATGSSTTEATPTMRLQPIIKAD